VAREEERKKWKRERETKKQDVMSDGVERSDSRVAHAQKYSKTRTTLGGKRVQKRKKKKRQTQSDPLLRRI